MDEQKIMLINKQKTKNQDEQKIMFIKSNIVNTNNFYNFRRKIAIYVINFTKNLSIFKIERDKNIL